MWLYIMGLPSMYFSTPIVEYPVRIKVLEENGRLPLHYRVGSFEQITPKSEVKEEEIENKEDFSFGSKMMVHNTVHQPSRTILGSRVEFVIPKNSKRSLQSGTSDSWFWSEIVHILRDLRVGNVRKALEYKAFLDACCMREVLRPAGGGHFDSKCCSRLSNLVTVFKIIKQSVSTQHVRK